VRTCALGVLLEVGTKKSCTSRWSSNSLLACLIVASDAPKSPSSRWSFAATRREFEVLSLPFHLNRSHAMSLRLLVARIKFLSSIRSMSGSHPLLLILLLLPTQSGMVETTVWILKRVGA
jgi:hypothetical protein